MLGELSRLEFLTYDADGDRQADDFDFGGRVRSAGLGDPNPAVAGEAWKFATETICAALSSHAARTKRSPSEVEEQSTSRFRE
jgi:hypothetical protein